MKTTPTLLRLLRAPSILTGLFLLAASPLSAQIVANFDAGETTSEIDGYTGMTGGGWLTPWVANSQSQDPDVEVLNTSPLQPGSGNYLNFVYEQIGATGSRSGYVVRRFDQDIALGSQAAFQLDFLLRLDTDLTELSHFFFTASVKNNPLIQRATTADQSAWGLGSFPNNSAAPTFRLVDGVDGGGDTAYDETGVILFTGDVYQMSFVVNPTLQEYVATVTNLSHAAESRTGPASYTSDVLEFAYKPTAGEVANYINFLTRGVQNDTMGFSLDSIHIAPIPEASWGGIAMGLAAIVLVLARRRRKA